MQFLPLYNSKTITLPIGVQSSCYGQLIIRFMSKEQYNDLLNALRKEAMSNMIKASIRQHFPEPLASQYCQRFDDFKMVVDLLEYKAKQNER